MGYKLKRILIYPDGVTEKQVRPKVYEYSYDFRNKSTTILTNDGWTFPSGTTGLVFDANGMHKDSAGWMPIVRPVDLNNARKITVTSNNVFSTSSSKSTTIRLCQTTTVSDTPNTIGVSVAGTTIYWILFSDNTQSATVTGTTQIKFIVDLEGKTMLQYVGSNTKSFSLSDADVTKIRGLGYIGCVACYSGNYMQDISLTVDY